MTGTSTYSPNSIDKPCFEDLYDFKKFPSTLELSSAGQSSRNDV